MWKEGYNEKNCSSCDTNRKDKGHGQTAMIPIQTAMTVVNQPEEGIVDTGCTRRMVNHPVYFNIFEAVQSHIQVGI